MSYTIFQQFYILLLSQKKCLICAIFDITEMKVAIVTHISLQSNRVQHIKKSWPPPELWTALWLVKNRSRGMIAGLWLDNTAADTFLQGWTIVWCPVIELRSNVCSIKFSNISTFHDTTIYVTNGVVWGLGYIWRDHANCHVVDFHSIFIRSILLLYWMLIFIMSYWNRFCAYPTKIEWRLECRYVW
jgi:hypothetical protein